MFKRILLAIDPAHAESHAKALPVAVELARRDGAELHVIAVLPDYGMAIVAGYFPGDFRHQLHERVETELKTLLDQGSAGLSAKRHVVVGHPAEEIVAAAERLDVDLIVMASHPPDRLRTLVLGSQADKVVHAAGMSVLVVRP